MVALDETTLDDDGDGIIAISDGFGETAAAVTVPVLPMPAHLEPRRTARSLKQAVTGYFYVAYNSDPAFRRHLASVGNDDSVTKNRMFDRKEAADRIKEMAQNANDRMTAEAPSGHIYKCLVAVMKNENLGWRVRLAQYRQLTHQAAE